MLVERAVLLREAVRPLRLPTSPFRVPVESCAGSGGSKAGVQYHSCGNLIHGAFSSQLHHLLLGVLTLCAPKRSHARKRGKGVCFEGARFEA